MGYNPEGRRQNEVSSDPNRQYLFDYVRVAPVLVYLDLELENIEEEKERIEKEKDHQRKLNDYTSWTRTFFDGDCCAEFAWMGPQNSSADVVNHVISVKMKVQYSQSSLEQRSVGPKT